jgi:hypothetical protein
VTPAVARARSVAAGQLARSSTCAAIALLSNAGTSLRASQHASRECERPRRVARAMCADGFFVEGLLKIF